MIKVGLQPRLRMRMVRSRTSRAAATRTLVAALLAVFLVPAPARANHSNPQLVGGPGHPLPVRPTSAAPVSGAPAGSFLTYYGGRVVSNMRVVQVLYGSGSYLANVRNTTSPSIGTFYQGVLNSPYVDWLTEYNTFITAS